MPDKFAGDGNTVCVLQQRFDGQSISSVHQGNTAVDVERGSLGATHIAGSIDGDLN